MHGLKVPAWVLYGEGGTAGEVRDPGCFLPKPFTSAELDDAVQEALALATKRDASGSTSSPEAVRA